MQVLITAGAVVGLYAFTQSQTQPERAYIMAQEIPSGTKIVSSDLKAIEIPGAGIRKGMVKDPKDVVGKYAASDLYSESYAMDDMFIQKDEIDPFESVDMNKLRKVSIPVEYTDAFGGNIKYGDRVDLAYTGKGENKDNGDFTYSKTFIQNVLVYSVTTDDGYRYADRSQRTDGQIATDEDVDTTDLSTGSLQTITLAVTPDQAEEIIARKEAGKVSVVGRFVDGEN